MTLSRATKSQQRFYYTQLLTLLEAQRQDYRHRATTNNLRGSVLITGSGLLAGFLSNQQIQSSLFLVLGIISTSVAVILGVLSLIPRSSLYNRLEDFEKEIDIFTEENVARRLFDAENEVQKEDEYLLGKRSALAYVGLWFLVAAVISVAVNYTLNSRLFCLTICAS